MLFWLLFISMFIHGYAAAADARVAPVVHQGAGASGLSWGEANGRTAHLSDVRTTVSPGLQTHRTVHQNNVRKRAFARALRRASVATDHSTIYRGRRCVLQGHRFQVQESRQRQPRLHQGSPTRRSFRARVRVLTINLGGLDTTTFDTFMAWLPTSPCDIICLQEVHFGLGRESNSWLSAGWRFVTTIDPSTRFQGVAILVREALCRTGELHYQEVVPGRLLHVRVGQEHHSLDILGIYQHALHLEAGKNNLSQRLKVWEKLGALLHNLSRRNMLIMLGDYNCTPEYVTGAMGHSYDKAGNYPDANEFAALLESHNLILLNGWVRRSQQFTFTGSKHQSIIDFVITRRHHADGQARQARTIPGINFSPWRLGGRHLAVGATLPLHPGWTSTSHRHPPESRKYDKMQLDQEARHGGPRIDALRTVVQEYLAGRPAVTLEQINAYMLSQVIRLFPQRSEVPEQRAWNMPQVRGSVTAMWQARARLRNIWCTTYTRLRFSMEAFKRYRAFMQAYRLLKQQGRQARRTLLTNELAAAAEAAQRHDAGQLHRIIRRLAPKHKRAQVRIHGPNGEMLRDSAEHAAIVSYFEDLFQSQTAPLPISPGRDAAPQVSEQEVYDALSSTKYGKAVPPASTPSSAVKCCADLLAQAITPAVNECLQGGVTPPRWANCHLALIPKPHKISKRPENLRPLGLQDCSAKAYARLLKNLLLQDVHRVLQQMPVFAYVPSRGTDDAIARVSDHCRRVRNSHQQQVSNVHTHRARRPKSGAYGGLQLAIDLTTAFDTVPRDELGRALVWAGANTSLVATILDLHSVCQYTIQHKGRTKCIHMRRGVRQGCTLAPLLYVVFSAYLISKLQARLPADWVRDHLTLYADDSHASFEIHSVKDLLQSLQIIACIFDVYREHGMRVNPLKSGVVLGVRGLQATELLKKHLQGTGDKLCLVIGIGKGELRIPVKTSMQYLGICVSYDNFEQETLTARLKVAQATRCRLSKVLSARRYLTQQQRIHLYVLCVRSATLYGLGAVGMTSTCLRKLQIFEVKHIRAIVRSPVHLTRETTVHLYRRLRLRLPAQQLHDMLRNRARNVRADTSHKQWISQRFAWLGESLQMQKAGLEQVAVAQEVACPTCGQYFATLKDMRSHHTKAHKFRIQYRAQGPAGRLHTLRAQDHSVSNMPICRHCNAKLSNWHNFRVHVLTSCPVLHATRASAETIGSAEQLAAGPTEEPNLRSAMQSAAGPVAPEQRDTPIAERADVLALLPQHNWKGILWLDGVKEQLRNHCIFCAQWVSSAPGALNRHVFALHPFQSRHSADASAQSLTLREGQQRPCGACGARPLHRTRHRSRVLYQLCLLRHSHLQALQQLPAVEARSSPQDGRFWRSSSDRSSVYVSSSGPTTSGPGGSGDGTCSPARPKGQTGGDGGGTGEVSETGGQRSELSAGQSLNGRAADLEPSSSNGGSCCPELTPERERGGPHESWPHSAVDTRGVGLLDRLEQEQQGALEQGAATGGGVPERECSLVGEDLNEARGRAEPETNGDGLHPHTGGCPAQCHPGAGRPAGAVVQDDVGVEKAPRAGQGQQLLAAYFVHRPPHVLRAQGTGGDSLGGHGGKACSIGLHPPAGRQSGVELPSVELRQGGAGAVGSTASVGHGAPKPPDGLEDQHRGARGAHQVPQLSQIGGAAQDGRHLLPGHRDEGSPSSHLLPGLAAAQLQCQHPADQDEVKTGSHGAPAPRESPPGEVPGTTHQDGGAKGHVYGQGPATVAQGEGPRPGRTAGAPEVLRSDSGDGSSCLSEPMRRLADLAARPVLRLALHNPHQLCYANSSLLTFLWMGMVQMACPGFDSTMLFGELKPQCLSLIRQETANLLRYDAWRSLLQAWQPALDRQQDAAEFLAFVLGRAMPLAYKGQWQSRFSVGRLGFIGDQGHCFQPLALEIHPDGLQASITAWHQQHYPHAFSKAPTILYLQIKRYTQKDGTIHKNMHFFDYQVGTEVRLPVFGSAAGLDVQWRSFSVMSVVVHAGLSVHSGHYQALLSGYQKRPSAHRWISLITDDGRTARECTEAQLQHAYCNCYLIGLCMLV